MSNAALAKPELTTSSPNALDRVAAPPVRMTWVWRGPFAPFVIAVALAAMTFVPIISENPRLTWTFLGIAAAVTAWATLLGALALRQGRTFTAEYFPVRAHYVQALVQSAILVWWGMHWANVYFEVPLIVGQLLFFYALDALITWSRGRTWRLGFGPFPIVISTNLLLWFKHDVYFLQFAMLTVGVLAKQFITWERDGRRTHIFNPSAFGQFVFATALIATGTTNDFTWGREIATTFEVPHMLLVIFIGGLIVQALFHVTLMTVAAVMTLVVVNEIYRVTTGLYLFVNINVAAPIFLGMHLLITDPATSPRTNLGRVLFGALYAMGYIALYRLFDLIDVPLFWDKLLPVPILNLCVPMIDRLCRSGALGRLNGFWESALAPSRMNAIHMACWAAFFGILLVTRYIEAPHPGDSIPFWKRAYLEGRPHAGHSFVIAVGSQAEVGGSGAAYNELGLICLEGTIVRENRGLAAQYFAEGCRLRDGSACRNVVLQSLIYGETLSNEDLDLAIQLLEEDCRMFGNAESCQIAGLARERSRFGHRDTARAVELYALAGPNDLQSVKGLARIALTEELPYDLSELIPPLARAASAGDVEALWYLAYMYRDGVILVRNEERARELLQRACSLGLDDACAALAQPSIPPFAPTVMSIPDWFTAFPIDD